MTAVAFKLAPAVRIVDSRGGAGSLVLLRHIGIALGGCTILDAIDLDIRRGEFVSLVGPSGCGKTTLLRAIGGLVIPRSGEITIDGKPLAGPSPEIAIVFQDYSHALLPWRTAAANISLALEARHIRGKDRSDRISSLLDKVGLSKHADSYPSQLSGGMQQRLQIARCLAQEPRVLLMDEPFGALDAMTRQTLQDELLSLVETMHSTVVFVTHDLEEAIYLSDRIVALKPYPGNIAEIIDVNLPRPRNQITTKEAPEFLRLRRVLFEFIQEAHR